MKYLSTLTLLTYLLFPTPAWACQCRITSEERGFEIIKQAAFILNAKIIYIEEQEGVNPNANHVAKLKIIEKYKFPEEKSDLSEIIVAYDGTSRCGKYYIKQGDIRNFILEEIWAHGPTGKYRLAQPCAYDEIPPDQWEQLKYCGKKYGNITERLPSQLNCVEW